MRKALGPAVVGMMVAAALAAPQRPSEADALAIEKSRALAVDYGKSLPDFICTEIIERYFDPAHRRVWTRTDVLTVKLTYFEQKENHELTLIDGKPTKLAYDSLQGAVGVGEFGATLLSIFDPSSQARFRWESWKTVRKHPAAVYSYAVEPSHSTYTMTSGSSGIMHRTVVGYHGVVEIDRDTNAPLHLTYQADHIPPELDLDAALTTVDYDLADVGGRGYWLPASSETEATGPHMSMRNRVQFRDYRKFSSESIVNFGTAK